MEHMQRQTDLDNVREHQESALPSKTLKRSFSDNLSTNKASPECDRKRRAVNKEAQCNAITDEGNESSKVVVFQPATPEDEVQSKNKSSNPEYSEYSLQSADYWDLSTYVNDEIAERLVTVPEFTFDPVTLRRDLAKMIILHEYPLSIVDHVGFRDVLHILNPLYGMISQSTVENDIKKIFKFQKCIAWSELGPNFLVRVAVTTKLWTSSDGNRRFLAITGHIIDREWKRQSYIMRFANVPLPCTNETISMVMLNCFSDFEVEKKLSTITVDSYSSNDELIDMLVDKLPGNKFLFEGKLSRLPCFARTMSLMVQDGFDVIRHVIENIRANIMFWTSSPQREKTFQKAASKMGVSTTSKLVLDCGLSWRSTYLMLQESFLFKDVFSRLRQQESCPSKEEWDLAREVFNRLQLLYDHMVILKEVPACLFFEHICDIKVKLSEWVNFEVPGIKEMALKMVEKFDKYWVEARDILGVATAFHPNYLFFPLEYYFPILYGNEAEGEIKMIRQIFYDLFKEYKSSLPMDETDDEDLPPWQSCLWPRHKMRLIEMKTKEHEEHEVDSYLGGYYGQDTKDSEILSWWKSHKRRFPVLHKMAKDILAIPIFSVDAENAFDVGDGILCANRSRLHPTMVETLMCTQRWVRNERQSDLTDSSSATNLHSFGTIHDDANVERGIIYKVKSVDEPSKSLT